MSTTKFFTLPLDTFTQPTTNYRLILDNFVKIDSKVDGENRETLYQSTDGSAESAPTLRIGYYPNAKANGGIGSCNYSIKLSRPVQVLDSNDEVVMVAPATVTLAWTMPGLSPVDEDTHLPVLLETVLQAIHISESAEYSDLRFNAASFGITDLLAIAWVDPTP
jgi:hypothetical protein